MLLLRDLDLEEERIGKLEYGRWKMGMKRLLDCF